jgi:hypothetical protein
MGAKSKSGESSTTPSTLRTAEVRPLVLMRSLMSTPSRQGVMVTITVAASPLPLPSSMV